MLTQKLASFAVDTKVETILAEVMQGARDALIDTLGVGLAGTLEPVSEIALRLVQEVGARRQATIWGTPLATSPADAAYTNGICAHALDFDDSHPHVRGHASAPMIATALAVGEVTGASGAAVLAAYALGLELAGKLGRAMGHGHYLHGWHSTSTIGTFSSAAVAARLWGLNAAEMRTAFGIAASQVSGLVRNFGTMTKPFHAGRAARAGVMAAWLAKNGHTADESIFDGKNNVLETYSSGDGAPLAEVIAKFGAPWEILKPGNWVKRWPCCYSNHRAIGGVLKLLEQNQIRNEEINSIAVGFLPGTDTALIHTNPQTSLEGKFSIEYTLAATVLDRKLTLESFTDVMVQRAPIRNLMAKVRRYRIEDSKVYGLDAPTDLEIDTARGKFSMHIAHTPGSPDWPMTDADRSEKFMDCGARVLGTRGAQHLLELAQRCEKLPDIRQLLKAAVPTAATPAKLNPAASPTS
jgi:2-methylcitrate dehydratase PrpD